MNKFIVSGVSVVLALGATLAPASAAVSVTALPDIGTFTGYVEFDSGQTYSGTGFLGVYNSNVYGQAAFAHLFGLEGASFSRTIAQIDISAFAGQTINSAILKFDILENFNSNNPLTVTGFAGNGALGYIFNAPVATYGTANAIVNGSNSVDITALVASAVGANANWLNLHLATANGGQWTYTYTGFGYSADRANVSLTIDSGAGVPEPATWALMIAGFGLVGAASRRRQSVRVTYA